MLSHRYRSIDALIVWNTAKIDFLSLTVWSRRLSTRREA